MSRRLMGNTESFIKSIFFASPTDEVKKQGLKTLNTVSVFLFFVCILFLIPFFFNDTVSLAWFFLSEAIAFALIPVLAKQEYVNTAKILHIAYIDIGIIILSAVFGNEAMIQAFFIPAMGLSILLFDAKNILLRNLSIFMSIASYFVLDYIIFDQLSITEGGFSIIRWSVLTAAFITTWIIFNTFSEFKENAENKTIELLDKEIELNRELNINQKKLEENIIQLENARKELVKSTKAKSEFLATMSHEIRTPMNAIMGMTHLLQKDNPREDQIEPLSILDFSGKTLLSLIDDVLDFSKIEAGKIEFEHIEFELNKLITTIMESFKVMAKNKGVDFKVEIDPSVQNILVGDPARLTQVLNNLLSNALKFTEKGEVILQARTLNDWELKTELEFSISDTGIGIPKERIHTVFDSFTQASGDTKRIYGGTGLGLTISKQIIELQGGSLSVDSEEGKGSTFFITSTFEKGNKNSKVGSDLLVKEPSDDMLKGIRVLLAEDNMINQKVMMRFFDRWHVEMTVVENGLEAVEEVKKGNFDVILMDLQMPRMDGYEATKAIRALDDPAKRRLPIVALTAAALKEVKEKVYACGMDDFVTKPFNPSELKQKLSDLVS